MTNLSPVDSILDAVFTVSPNLIAEGKVSQYTKKPHVQERKDTHNWNRVFSPLKTPAVTGPLCRPNLIVRSSVPGPSSSSSDCDKYFILLRQS